MANGNEKKFELKIRRTGIFVVVMGMTALLCASFLFGVDVGQNIETYPEKISSIPQRALALVWRPAKIKLAQQNSSGDNTIKNQLSETQEATASPAEENIDLTYHRTLTSKKGLAKPDSFAEKKPVIAAPKNEEESQKGKFHIETQTENLNQNQSATQMESVKEPVKQKEIPKFNTQIQTKSPSKNADQNGNLNKKESLKEKENIKQKDTKKAETGDQEHKSVKQKFIVQVASLKDKSTAYKMNKEIASLGFQSKIIKTEIKGKGILYRVVVSDLNDKEQAQKAAKKISAKTRTNCIVKKIENKTKEN